MGESGHGLHQEATLYVRRWRGLAGLQEGENEFLGVLLELAAVVEGYLH